MLARPFAAVASLLFPTQCPVTGQAVATSGFFSPEGWARLSFVAPPGCSLCGAPFDHAEKEEPLCAPCAAPHKYPRNLCGPKRLDAVQSALRYDEVSAQLALSLKYADRQDLVPALGAVMKVALDRLAPSQDAVLAPVPLHPSRLRQRRFNQAALLASALSKRSGLAADPALLLRRKATSQQKGLGFEGRFRNLSGAFEARPAAQGRNVIIVDDVLTSGATLVGCARALRRAGARGITAVTLARVFPDAKAPQVDLPEL
ncbi:phosphoribosyltransferase [Parvularcula lutaonensis]|nr:phosphoribosyltransferase [Parvularcula lutaonensis]